MDIDRLRALLGITDESQDVLIMFALENAREIVKSYCHVEEIPEELGTMVLRMAVDIYRNEQLGKADVPQTVSSVKVGDTSTSFQAQASDFTTGLLKSYKMVLNRYRKAGF